jgi:hypothetical protein
MGAKDRERLPLPSFDYTWERNRFTECQQWRRLQRNLENRPDNDSLAAAYLINEVWGDA